MDVTRRHSVDLVLIALLATGSITVGAQENAARNPGTAAADVAAGQATFRSRCSICHGRSARGDRGPDLTRGRYLHATSDEAMFQVIREGLPGTDMPGLYLADATIWQLVAYVRSLAAAATPVEVAGDPQAGSRVFSQQDCTQCHVLDGEGGRRAPDLSHIGWRRSPESLRLSLLEPDAEVHPRWWGVRAVEQDGTVVTGWRLDEDTYSVRLLDADDNLRALEKRTLREVERLETSPMGSYEGLLTDRELDDLVAYLYSLRGDER